LRDLKDTTPRISKRAGPSGRRLFLDVVSHKAVEQRKPFANERRFD